ncbi:MAG: transglycosylase domain-containing protein [Candidatus Binatia bacterium]
MLQASPLLKVFSAVLSGIARIGRAALFRPWGRRLLLILVIIGALTYELRTATLQARVLSSYATKLSYALEAGASPRIAFPHAGPFDQQRGYTRLPDFITRATANGYQITQQVHMSPELTQLIDWGISPPYREPAATGLIIRGAGDSPLYDASQTERFFRDFTEIPPLLLTTLLFIENRELHEDTNPRHNPVIEWDRLVKAGVLYAGYKLGFSVPVQGGSTLATQLEKYRHSPGGRTTSILDKGRQILGASLKAYSEGENTLSWRRTISLDYLNTMPLAAAPGYGEVYGLGPGLWVWFGLRLPEVCAVLNTLDQTPSPAKVYVYKHVLALFMALRAPTTYLVTNRTALTERTNQYLHVLAATGVLDATFAQAVERVPITFRSMIPTTPRPSFTEYKATNAVRTSLLQLLDIPQLYDLDRLHLQVNTTIDSDLQYKVGQFLQNLTTPEFVAEHGLDKQERLLRGVDAENVSYSFLLFERTPEGNALRVQADSLDQPFDLNRGVKLELGSTAKLRTLAHYLELMTELYQEFVSLEASALQQRASDARDPLTRWAAETLKREKNPDLHQFLLQALDRRYSASPYETFFTGSGAHRFNNFSRSENRRILSVREALQRSTNLVFIRLMRDLVRFHQARLPYDVDTVLSQPDDPLRQRMLEELAEEEAKAVLLRGYAKYHDLPQEDLVAQFLGKRAKSLRHLAILFFAWNRTVDHNGLADWLQQHLGAPVSEEEVAKLWRAYSNPDLNLADYGYLLSRNSLEVWCAGALFHEPALTWEALFAQSGEARKIASAWLFKSRNRRAQNLRLRIRVEQDAFARMTPYWQRLGFPFAQLVPSYATALGNSSDQPIALAELMGIIMNNGVRRPSPLIKSLHFAEGTPYETTLQFASNDEQVLEPEVAVVLKTVLAEVVEKGTAQRVKGAFQQRDETILTVGGKTGSGDNRFQTISRGGRVLSSRAVNRTATFVFYIGDRYFGVITALVRGPEADDYSFTSVLPVTVLKLLAPTLLPHLSAPPAVDVKIASATQHHRSSR